MANSILSTFLAKASMSILNQTTGQTELKDIKVSKVVIKLSAEPMRHMLEDGTTIVDVRIIKPIHVTADVICPDDDSLSSVNQILDDRQSRYQITSRGVIIANVVSDTDAIVQSADMLSATPIRMSFKQLLLENISPVVFASSASASVVDRGIAIINDATTSVTDLYNKAAKAVSTAIN